VAEEAQTLGFNLRWYLFDSGQRGTYLGRDAGALVRLVPGKFQKQSAELFQRKITAEDVESALQSAAD
jgi:hypothetical protein